MDLMMIIKWNNLFRQKDLLKLQTGPLNLRNYSV
jgi:hypothetical protein